MKQFDVVSAVFKPKREDDLVSGAKQWIDGPPYKWQAVFKIESGEYKEQWAMMLVDINVHPPFAWAPESDLEVEAKE